MWFYKGIKVNISATTEKIHCSINLQHKSCTQTKIIAENNENSLHLVPHTIENIQFINCEKFSPIPRLYLALSQVQWLLLLIALTPSVKRQQLTAT